ncbi:MAG TPA: hypothetical protein VM779_03495 [Thermoanaerobaculia bacterium]|nr:hypothetical protein [Thermoanaerobaculia bacterium]
MRTRGGLLVVAAAAFAAAFAAGLCRIADLDFWWHLETGEQIVRTGSIPREDVYSYTARGREYIDHEWLFQLSQYAIFTLFGAAGIAIAKSLVIAVTLTIAGWYALRRGAGVMATVGLIFVAVAGGITRLIERPEIFSVLFAVVTYVLLDEFVRGGDKRLLFAVPLVAALWANVHAAVIVGIVIQGLFAAALFFENRSRFMPVFWTAAASVAASLINPFGVRVLTVPFELTRIIESGVLDNEEWRQPTLFKTPVFFLAFVLVAILLLMAARERRWRSIFVGLFLGYISLRYIRNVALFCTFVPLLVAPEVAALRRVWKGALLAFGTLSLIFVLTVYYPFQRGFGVASYFPVRIASFVERRDLRGPMMNSYGFGGYLIWALFPERLVFIDGRNEVFLPLMEKLAAARSDSRAWTALLREYQIEYALLEYVDALDRVTTIGHDGTVTTSLAPVTATRFPRSRWALVYFDDVGMIFIRRDGTNQHLLGEEYTAVFPEGEGYQRHLVESGAIDRRRVISELQRKLREQPDSRRAQRLLASVAQNR